MSSVSNLSTIIGNKYSLVSPTGINTITYPNVKISQLSTTINNLFNQYGSGQTNYVSFPIKMSDLSLTLINSLVPVIKTGSTTYTPGTSGSVNVPAGASRAYITMTGAGGGGGGGGTSTTAGQNSAGGGGGGSGDIPGSCRFSVPVSGGITITLSISSGGSGGVVGASGTVANNTTLNVNGIVYTVIASSISGRNGGDGLATFGQGGVGANPGSFSQTLQNATDFAILTTPTGGVRGADSSIYPVSNSAGGAGGVLAGAASGGRGQNTNGTLGTPGAAGANGSIVIYYT